MNFLAFLFSIASYRPCYNRCSKGGFHILTKRKELLSSLLLVRMSIPRLIQPPDAIKIAIITERLPGDRLTLLEEVLDNTQGFGLGHVEIIVDDDSIELRSEGELVGSFVETLLDHLLCVGSSTMQATT